MELVTAVRSQVPVSPTPPAIDRHGNAPATQGAPPVAATIRRDAVQHQAKTAGAVTAQVFGRDEGKHPAAEARAAADAARDAYIKASIAAGINPLPLP